MRRTSATPAQTKRGQHKARARGAKVLAGTLKREGGREDCAQWARAWIGQHGPRKIAEGGRFDDMTTQSEYLFIIYIIIQRNDYYNIYYDT